MIKLNDKAINVFHTLYNAVYSEECGSTVRISDEFSSKKLKALMKELKIPPASNLCKEEMEWAIAEFFVDNPDLKVFDLSVVNTWLKDTDLNAAAKKIFRKTVKEHLDND